MGRKSVEMKLIDDKKRRTRTYSSRKLGVVKKARELSTLCNVDVGVIIFGPKGGTPEVWPKEPNVLGNILARYQNTPFEDRMKKMMKLSDFIKVDGKNNDDGDVDHQYRDATPNYSTWDDRLDNFSPEQLMALCTCLDSKLEVVKTRIDMMKGGNSLMMNLHQGQSSQSYNGSEDHQLGTTNNTNNHVMAMPIPPFQCQYPIMNDDNKFMICQDQRNADEFSMMRGMLMMNGVGSYNPSNNNTGANDCTGYATMPLQVPQDYYNLGRTDQNQQYSGNEVLWHPSPLACYYNPYDQQQAPHFGC